MPESGAGKTYTKLVAPDTEVPDSPASSSEVIAISDGAGLKVKAAKTTSFTIDGVEVLPVQPDPVDRAGGQPRPPNFFAPSTLAPAST